MPGSRGAGRGTATRHGVVETLNAPFAKAAGAGRSSGPSANHAPFSTPQSTGGGGIPTQFFSDMGQKVATSTPPSGVVKNSSLGTIAAGRRR
jgi:hypothetical protein